MDYIITEYIEAVIWVTVALLTLYMLIELRPCKGWLDRDNPN